MMSTTPQRLRRRFSRQRIVAAAPAEIPAVPSPETRSVLPLATRIGAAGSDYTVISALSALAQATRLRVFRLLVRNHPTGMTPGDLAREIELPHNTLSSHLATMREAHLVTARRAQDGRSQIYTVDIDFVGDVIAHVLEDCCGGRPEFCRPVLDAALGRQTKAECSGNGCG